MAAKLGSGARFKALTEKLQGKVTNPAAVAAVAGRAKYGQKRMSQMAAAGKKRKRRQ